MALITMGAPNTRRDRCTSESPTGKRPSLRRVRDLANGRGSTFKSPRGKVKDAACGGQLRSSWPSGSTDADADWLPSASRRMPQQLWYRHPRSSMPQPTEEPDIGPMFLQSSAKPGGTSFMPKQRRCFHGDASECVIITCRGDFSIAITHSKVCIPDNSTKSRRVPMLIASCTRAAFCAFQDTYNTHRFPSDLSIFIER